MAFVYLLGKDGDNNFFKIGVTRKNVETRLKQLQTGNDSEIYIADKYSTEIPFILEKMLHRKFNHNKKNGEWFKMDIENVMNFRKICKETEETIEVLKSNPFFVKENKIH